jgi:hypothetical protein
MAVATGTASNYRDLLDRLRTFLTTDAALVAAGQAWTQLRWDVTAVTQELILRGPGLAGADQVFIGVRSSQDTVNDWFNWHLAGFTAFEASAAWAAQPGGSTGYNMALNLWNGAIPYTFVANGRRVIVAVRVNSVWFQAYLGLGLSLALPHQDPYPLVILGNSNAVSQRWSGVSSPRHGIVRNGLGWYGSWVVAQYENIVPTDDGIYVAMPVCVFHASWAGSAVSRYEGQYFCELDGMFFVPGLGVVSDDIVEIDGVDHLVVQRGTAAALTDYVAIRLE